MQSFGFTYIPEDRTLDHLATSTFDVIYTSNTSPTADTIPPPHVNPLPSWHIALFGAFACAISALTVGGNLIVILSFVLERNIRQPTNYFIASLAVSDLLIGTVSMPFYTVYLLSGQYWPLGEHLCDLWLSLDYTACLCSIYTVFCITADRFFSVKLPAKYRRWRTKEKVLTIIGFTWFIPMAVFFTSIFGWQHFVGRRTVPAGKCYVQYMEDSLFNCLLQVGYFWITLTAMFVLYIGIYRVALDLHRRSAAQKAKTMSCLVSMAGRTVTQLGTVISITRRPCRSDCVERFSPIALNQRTETGEGSSDYDMSKSGCVLGGCASTEDNVNLLPFWMKGTNLNHSSTKNCKSSNSKIKESEMTCGAAMKSKNISCTATKSEEIVRKESEFESKKRIPNRDFISKLPSTDVYYSKQTVENNQILHEPNICDKPEKINHSHCADKELPIADPLSGKYNSSTSDITKRLQFTSSTTCAETCNAKESKVGSIRRLHATNKPEYFVSSAAYAVTAIPEELLDVQYADDDDQNSVSLQLLQQNPDVEVASLCRFDHMCEELLGCKQFQLGCSQSKSGISLEVQCEMENRSSNDERVQETEPLTRNYTDDCKSQLRLDYKERSVSCRLDKLIDAESNGESATDLCSSSRNDESITKTQSNEEEEEETQLVVAERHQSGNISNLLSLPRPHHNRKKQSSLKSNKNQEHERDSPSRSQLSSVKYVFPGGSAGAAGSNESRRTTETRQLLHNDNRTRKALRTITIILGAFVVCWIPWHVLSMIIGFCNDTSMSCGVEPTLYDISYWLCYLNSPLNPFCYAFVNQQFKKTFIRILKLDWRKK